MNTRAIGAKMEKASESYLISNNFNILERNYKNKLGEIDIIAQRNNIIHFIEVKYRANNEFFNISNNQINRIYRSSQIFIINNKNLNLKDYHYSYDIIFIDKNNIINHMNNALQRSKH